MYSTFTLTLLVGIGIPPLEGTASVVCKENILLTQMYTGTFVVKIIKWSSSCARQEDCVHICETF